MCSNGFPSGIMSSKIERFRDRLVFPVSSRLPPDGAFA